MLRVASVFLLFSLAGVPTAHAFERTRVDSDPDKSLFWQFRTVLLHPAYDTSGDIGEEAVAAALARSIASWNVAGAGCSDLALIDDGYPSGLSTNMLGGAPDMQNRIVWRELEWPPEIPSATLAITTLVYRRSTGEIADADIDLNGVHHVFTNVDDPALTQTDVENTLTHELGHLIGLAHTDVSDATMYSVSLPGDLEKRSLTDDEREGLCFIYPEGRLTPTAPRIPGGPLVGGCRIGRGTSARGALAALALLIPWLLRRRRAARR